MIANMLETQFMSHMTTHALSYATKEEYEFRFNLFKQADAAYEAINHEAMTYSVGHNFMSTMTEAEKKQRMGKFPGTVGDVEYETVEEEGNGSVDWRKLGGVNKVQNQGGCGSCWAFSTTAAMEGNHFAKTKKLLKLSESQLVDCDKGDGGCQGGLEWNAMKYLMSNAQESESDYGYVARKQTCKFTKSKGLVNATKVNYISQSASALRSSIDKGPTCIGVNASSYQFQGYTHGILSSTNCGTNQDHAITAVGYGAENGTNFVIVRNSWGANWGESGYIRMSLDVAGKGTCGILVDITRPTTN